MMLSSVSLVFAIDPNEKELKLAELIVSHPDQRRSTMVHDPILLLAARTKALDLGRRNYAGHVDPDGFGPNELVKSAGYGLPDWWEAQTDQSSNQVESLGFGYGGSLETIFEQWTESELHRRHVLASSDFFRNHIHYAVGYANVPGSTYTHYFVLITAPPNESPLKEVEPYREWLLDRYSVKEIQTQNDETDTDGDGLSRLLEFALNTNPDEKDFLAPLMAPPGTGQLEWRLPQNDRLGSVTLRAEFSQNLQDWDGTLVRHENDRFVIDRTRERGFLRLKASIPGL